MKSTHTKILSRSLFDPFPYNYSNSRLLAFWVIESTVLQSVFNQPWETFPVSNTSFVIAYYIVSNTNSDFYIN